MLKPTTLILLLLTVVVPSTAQYPCRFAHSFKTIDLYQNPQIRQQFLRTVLQWQSKFIKQVGVQNSTGMTFDGQRVDYDSGELIQQEKHYFTASSKQSLHVAILAKVLEGDQKAQIIYTVEEAVEVIRAKTQTYEKFNSDYPGFGGFLPWVALNQSGEVQPTWDFKNRTPALDNGQLFWASYALTSAWQLQRPSLQPILRERFANITWRLMLKNLRRVFFNITTGKIRAVATIQDISLVPQKNTYTNNDNYYLDDPYQGELVTQIITVLSDDFTDNEISKMWVDKRNKLKAVNFEIKELNKTVTGQKGFWFSAHQQWKNLFLPYQLSKSYWRIFENNQKIRTWNSVQKGINGLYAATTGTANSNDDKLDYFADCGIPQMSSQPVTHLQQITPYSSFPLFLSSPPHATAWYHNMLLSPSAQTKYGSLEATNVTGFNVSPMLTWDTKITTVVAMLGGTRQIVEFQLYRGNRLGRFVNRVEIQYALAFNNAVGFDVGYALPDVTVGEGKEDFTSCAKEEKNLTVMTQK